MGEYVLNASPDIEAGGCGKIMGNPIAVRVSDDQSPVAISVAAMNQGARDVFGFELVAGNWEDLTGKGYALSESAAQRLGVQVGDVIKYHDGSAWQEISIVAIYKDMPKHSDLSSFEMLANLGDVCLDDWSEFSFFYFLKLRKGADPNAITEVAKPCVRQFFSETNGGMEFTDDDVKFGLYPVRLTDMYFDSNSYYAPGKAGNKTTTMTLLIIAIFVVAIAFINYINFFFAMVPLRLKSINTRKILGSSRFQLVMSSVGESVLMVVIALGLAVAVIALFRQSTLASLIDTSLKFSHNWGIVALTVGMALFVSVAASIYPALFATSFNPAFALKGTLGTTQKGKAFRIGLIGLQFTVSIALIICAIFVHEQRRYMMEYELGFNQECLLQSQVSWNLANNREAVESQLRTDAAIKDIAWGDGAFVRDSRMSWGRRVRGEEAGWQVYPVSWNFLRFMGIDIVEGRDFTPADEQSDGVYIFNETARDCYGITLEDQLEGWNGIEEIAGFCKDFNFASLRQPITPFAFFIYGKEPVRPCMRLFIRTEAGVDVPALIERTTKTLNDLDPDLGDGISFEVQPFSQSIESQYKKEKNLSKLVNLFTVLAIVISLMGVFGLVMFETEHRRKEIGIRRVHGATVQQILAMFNSRFVKIVLVCFVIAVPVSIVIMRRYLEGFAYQVPLHVWVFAIALLAVLGVTIAVVTLRSLRAATVNPVKSLRNE